MAKLREEGYKKIFGDDAMFIREYSPEDQIRLLFDWYDFLSSTFGFKGRYIPCYLYTELSEFYKDLESCTNKRYVGRLLDYDKKGVLNLECEVLYEPSWYVKLEGKYGTIADDLACIKYQTEILGYHRMRLEKPELFNEYVKRIEE